MTDHGYEVLERSELPLDTVELARDLIGKLVVRVADVRVADVPVTDAHGAGA